MLEAMRPRALIAGSIVLGLGAIAASVEYGQYSSLMQQTTSADVMHLCMSLREAHRCPAELAFPDAIAKIRGGQPYRCRTTLSDAIVYMLGAEGELGGASRDSDIACSTYSAASSPEQKRLALAAPVRAPRSGGADPTQLAAAGLALMASCFGSSVGVCGCRL